MRNNNKKKEEAPHFIQERRKLLHIASEQYEKRLKDQVEEMGDALKENASKWGKNALVISGTLWLSYKLFKSMASNKKKVVVANEPVSVKVKGKKIKTDKVKISRKRKLFNSVKQNIALFLLTTARNRLLDYLENQGKTHEQRALPYSEPEKAEEL